jgi:hypothetical protein
LSRGLRSVCAWCGPVMVALLAVGLIPLAGFIPPPSPAASAESIQAFYLENLTGIRIGMYVSCVGFALMAPWGIALAMETKRSEPSFPILTYIQIACVGGGTAMGVLDMLVWALAAFRPDEASPDITRMLNDLGWFLFLFYWPPFSVWCAAIGVAILRDPTSSSFPRWAGYLSLWTALLFIPAGLIVFFKTGPFAFDGLLAFYIPVIAFFGWFLTMSVLLIRATARPHHPHAVLTAPPRNEGSFQ